ncbi:guanylate kinase [Actinomadura sp. DC4]|uniref:guanylate kinase n=1 Tax=Actinomadura sp. DC4 TaxID=3055069 RepID=UPI0025AF569F|nr:guanylate kinase [Actinomadura sp. DC4]MDN3357799.1 guanylate kinase [Actinomadura sp. DC4]
MTRGVILYGPPAAGKDTITEALHRLDPRYGLFRRLKAGAGKTAGYRMTSRAALGELRESGALIWENSRYDAVYAVDRPALLDHLAAGYPVLHLGQVEAIDAVIKAMPDANWMVVYVWCPRDIAEKRLTARNPVDVEDRLKAWDQTVPIEGADLTIDTAETAPDNAAEGIHGLF